MKNNRRIIAISELKISNPKPSIESGGGGKDGE